MMDYETIILDKLLDKYEERVSTSNRRVRIILDKNEVKVPNIESSEYIEFRETVFRLKNKGFIDVDWVRKDYIIKSIWLNLDNVDTVYHYLERQTRNSKATVILNTIETALQRIMLTFLGEKRAVYRQIICLLSSKRMLKKSDGVATKAMLALNVNTRERAYSFCKNVSVSLHRLCLLST